MGWGGVSQREGGTGQIHPCGMWAPPMADFGSALPRDLAEPFLEGLCLQTPSSPVSLPHLSSQVTVLHLGISSPTPAPSSSPPAPPRLWLWSAAWKVGMGLIPRRYSNLTKSGIEDGACPGSEPGGGNLPGHPHWMETSVLRESSLRCCWRERCLSRRSAA